MPTSLLTKEELTFLKRAEGMSLFFEKIGQAKQLIREAQVEMAQFERVARKSPKQAKKPKPRKTKARKPSKPSKLEFGVDLPDTLSDTERKVYAELQKAGVEGRKPRELAEALKLTASQLGRATSSLKKRGLITSTGATLSKLWKAK